MVKKKLSETEISGVLAERRYDDGRRKIKLRKDERKAMIKQKDAEAAAALFLDLEEARNWDDIAAELDMSVHQLKALTKTPEFNLAYNALFPDIGHDPRYKAAQGALSDMLPAAIQQLKSLLTNPQTPPSVRLKAVDKVLSLNAVAQEGNKASDRSEMVKFLTQQNISMQDVKILVPEDYMKAMVEYETVDANFHEVAEEPDLLEAPPDEETQSD